MDNVRITNETALALRGLGIEALQEMRDRLAACGQVSEIENRLMKAYSLGYLRGLADGRIEPQPKGKRK